MCVMEPVANLKLHPNTVEFQEQRGASHPVPWLLCLTQQEAKREQDTTVLRFTYSTPSAN